MVLVWSRGDPDYRRYAEGWGTTEYWSQMTGSHSGAHQRGVTGMTGSYSSLSCPLEVYGGRGGKRRAPTLSVAQS